MKKILLHIVIISYAALMFRPTIPYVHDFIDHLFFYTQHLATIHAEKGNFHVHVEVAKKAGEENNKEKNMPSSQKRDNPLTEHCAFLLIDEQISGNSAYRNYVPVKKGDVINGNVEKNYPPPRCS